jgi:hypothetical protein
MPLRQLTYQLIVCCRLTLTGRTKIRRRPTVFSIRHEPPSIDLSNFFSVSTMLENDGRCLGSSSQQDSTRAASSGTVSCGIGSLLFWNATAPTTCAGLRPFHGCCIVMSSHKITPKLYTSHFSFDGSPRRNSGAIHSGVPATDLEDMKVFALNLDKPKSPT